MLFFALGLLLTVGACVWMFFDLASGRGALSRRLPFMLLALSVGVWAGGEMLILYARTPEDRVIARQIIYTGAGNFAVCWLWASAALARPRWYRRAPWLVALAFLPGLLARAWLFPDMQERFAAPERYALVAGPLFWASMLFAWALVVVGSVQFLMAGRRVAPARRSRLVLIGVCVTLPFVWQLGYQFLRVPGADWTPVWAGVCGILLRFALFDPGLGAVLPMGQWTVLDQLRTGILLADTSGTVVDANPAARRVLAMEEPRGHSLDALLASAREDPERSIDVERVPLRRPLSGHVGYAALLTDRTEAARLEDHLREQQRLESMGMLAGGLAHDFQNLLTGILTSVGLTRLTLEPRHPARKPLDDVVKGAKTAAQLTGQLLALSGRRGKRLEPLDLSDEVRNLEGLLAGGLPKRVALDLDLADGIPAVEADRTEMQQVVTNLVVNAGQAVEGAGLVQVRTWATQLGTRDLARLVPGHAARPGRHVVLEVADDGPGIDAETRERIFEPFFTTRAQGHGMGLAVVLGIAHRHGGGVEVTAEPGEGATFCVYLPASSAVSESAPAPPPRGLHAVGAGTLLVVDDEDALRESVASALERVGYSVLRAEDGNEALEIFREREDEIDLVLLDLEMPGLDGRSAWHAMRGIRDDVRVVLMSAFRGGEPPAAGAPSEAGGGGDAAAVLRKPYDLEQLFATVRAVLEEPRRSARA